MHHSVKPLLIAAGFLAAAAVAPAASLYFDTNGATAGSGNADGTWSAGGGNWTTDSAGGIAGTTWTSAADTAVFAAGTDFTGTRVVTVSGTVGLSGITVESEVVNLTIGGGTLDFGSTTGVIDTSAWGTTSAKFLTINSVITGANGLTINSNGNLSPNGGNNTSITKLGGANTFTGNVTINSGLVSYASDAAFGNASNLIILNGGGLLDPNLSLAINHAIRLDGTGGTIRSYGSATSTFNGVISGTGSLTFTDGGTKVLTGNNTYSGGTVISSGSVSSVRVGNNNALGTGTVSFVTTGFINTLGVMSGGSAIALANAVSITSGATAAFDTANADLTLNGVVSGTGGNLTKSGVGTLIINAANTYTGTTLLSAGTLAVGNDAALGTGTVNLNSAGATIRSADTNARTLANAVSLSANTNFGTVTTGNLTFTGALAGGAGAKTFTVNNATTTFSGAITATGGAAVALTKSGTGTLVFSGNNSALADQMIVNGGTLLLDYTADNSAKISGAALINFGGGNLSVTGNGSADTTQSVLSTTLNNGSATVTVTRNAAANNATLNLNAITRSVGGALNVVYNGTGTGVASVTTDTLNTNGILGGWATVNGADWASNTPNAADGAIGAYTGYVADTWAAGNNTDVSLAGANPASGSTTNSLRFNAVGAKTLTLAGVNTLTSGGLLVTSGVGVNGTTITGGTLTGSASGELTVNQYNTGGTLTISSVIADNTAATALSKNGGGTLILSGTNTYTGKTYLNAGVTRVTADANLGAAPGAATADQLTFNGGTLQFGASVNLATNRGITINGNGATIDTNGFNTTVNATVAGAGMLTKKGSGELTLSGGKTFTGGVILNAGTIRVNNAGSLGTGAVSVTGSSVLATSNSTAVTLANAVTIASGSTLSVDSGFASLTFGNVIDGAGNLATTSSGTTILTAANTYTGTTTIGANTLQLGNGATNGTLGSGALAIGSTGTLLVNRSNAYTLSNTVTGSGTIATSNSGTLTLAGDLSAYTGKLTVYGSTVVLDYTTANSSKIGNAAALTLGGSLVLNGGSHAEVAGSTAFTASTASSVSRASGTSTIALGALTRSAGATLNVASAGIAGTSSANNASGILGGWATLGGVDWAANDGAGNIVAYTGYTDTAFGGVIADGAATNVRLSGGVSGNVTLSSGSVTIGTLLQNQSSAVTIDSAGGTLRLGATGGILIASGKGAVTIGTAAGSGVLTAGGADNTAGEIIANVSGGALTVNSVIANNGTGAVGLTKTGPGDLILAGANTYSGGTSLTGGGIRLLSNNTAFGTGAVVVGGASSLSTAAGSNAVTLSNAFALNSLYSLTLDSSNASLTLSGVLSGAGSLLTSGSGITTLAGANTYSGTTTIGSGTSLVYSGLQIGNGGATGAIGGGAITLGSGSVNLVYARTGTTTMNQLVSGGGNLVVMSGQLNFGSTSVSNTFTGDAVVYGGTLNLSGDFNNNARSLGTASKLYVMSGGTATTATSHVFGSNGATTNLALLGGTMTTANGFYVANVDLAGGTLQGAGDFRSGASRTISVLPSANQSLIDLVFSVNAVGSNTATLYVNDGPAANDLVMSKNITNATGVVKAGAGILRMTTSTAHGYTGVTTLAGGSLILDYSASALATNMLAAAGTATFSGGNLTLLGKTDTAITQTLGNPTLTAGGSSLTLTSGSGAGTLGLTLGNTWTRAVGATLDIALSGGATLTSAPTLTNGILSYATVNGTDFATVSGGNIVANTAYSTDDYSGATINTDVVASNPAPAAFTVNSLSFRTAQANTLTLTGTNTAGALLVGSGVGANATVITGGTLQGTASGELIVQQLDAAGTLTINSVIANNTGATALVKAGAGLLVLGGTNTYTGTTYLNGGTTRFTTAANLGGAAAGITFGGGALQWATGSTVDITSGRTVTIGGGGAGFDTNGNNVTLATAFGAGSSGTLTKSGAGTLTLTAANANFTGAVVVNAGKIVATNGSGSSTTGTLGAGSQSVLINSGGTLELNSGGHNHVTAELRNYYVNGGVLQNTAGAANRLGNLWLNGGTLNTQNGASSGYTAFYLGTLQAGNAGANATVFVEGTTASQITTTGSSFNGIQLGPNVAFQVADVTGSAATDLTVGVALLNQSADQSSAAAGFTKFGAGTMTLTAANTYSGVTTVAAGTLQVGNAGTSGTLGTGGAVIVNSGAAVVFNRSDALAVGNAISGAGSLTQTGTGTTTISGANVEYTGIFSINAGSVVAAHASAFGTGAVSLAGGSLQSSVANVGAGSFAMNNAGSTLALNGTGAGSVTVAGTGNVTITAGTWLIQNLSSGNSLDRIIGGTGTFTGTGFTLDLGGDTFLAGSSYTLITGFTGGKTIGSVTIANYNSGSVLASLDASGTLTFTAVPEPSTYGLIGAGALAAAAMVRRRRSKVAV